MTSKMVEKEGMVKTILGRRRYFPEINSPNHDVQEFARRAAINTPIQGAAADIIKLAMVKVYREFKQNNFASKMIMQIHDELVFDVKKEEFEPVKKIVRENMEGVMKLKVPLKVNLEAGNNWLEMEEIE